MAPTNGLHHLTAHIYLKAFWTFSASPLFSKDSLSKELPRKLHKRMAMKSKRHLNSQIIPNVSMPFALN